MSFSVNINLGTVGPTITSVKLYSCNSSCSSCTSISGYESVLVSSFPRVIGGVPDGTANIKAEPIGSCSGLTQCIVISGLPGPTPTPTATPSVALPGCGDTISDSYTPSGNTIQTHYLDLTDAANGDTITLHYTANERPDRFNIYDDSNNLIVNSGWVGSDNTYAGPWGTAGSLVDADGDGYMNFTYNSSKTYKLTVDVGPANPSNILSDGWTVTIACTSPPPPPGSTTKYIVKKCAGSGGDGVTTYKIDVSLVTTGKTYTFNSGPGGLADMNGENCWDVISSVTDTSSPDYVVPSYNNQYADCGDCTPVYFDGYTGSTLNIACAGTYPTRMYYRGGLGVAYDTVLYLDSGFTQTVNTPGYYWYDTNNVFIVGLPSVEDGRITDVQACPPPAPTATSIPEDPTVHVYEYCPQNGNYYWNYDITAGRAIDGSSNCYIRMTSSPGLLSSLQYVYPSLTYNPDLVASNNTECPCE